MIEQVTGLPGAGKTLITLARIKELSEKEGRPVYYNGIPDLKLPWLELENGEDWWKVPPGAIVVIDEAQRVFRPRANGSQVPEHVSKLETHRHLGIDLILITQHPMLLDTNVRRLVGRHIHTVRAFGAKFATLHEWPQVKENCDKSRADSIEHKWFYPRQAFDWYKSAEVHTHKMRLPMRLVVLLLVPVVLAAAIYGFWQWQISAETRTKEAIKKSTGLEAKQLPGVHPVVEKRDYVADYAPRVAGLAYTAPIYDDVTKPVRAPYPAACVDLPTKGCRCYSQQATRLDVPLGLCKQIASTGFFVAWDEEKNDRPSRTASEPKNQPAQGQDLPGAVIAAPAPMQLSPSPKPDGGGPSTNPKFSGAS